MSLRRAARPNRDRVTPEGKISWRKCDCGKRGFPSRKVARRVLNGMQQRGGMSVYRCLMVAEFWHVGHIPERVRTGDSTRGDHYRGGRS